MLDILKVKVQAMRLAKREQKETNGLLMLATNTAKNLHSSLGMQMLKTKKMAKALNKIVSDLKQNIASKTYIRASFRSDIFNFSILNQNQQI